MTHCPHYPVLSFRLSPLLSLLSLLFAILMTGQAKADINYTFVKLTCDSTEKTAIISVRWDWNEAGKSRVKELQKDEYYFSEITSSKKSVECNIMGDHQISLIAIENQAHPRNNNIQLFFDKEKIPGSYPAVPMDIKIHFINKDEYEVERCVLERSTLIDTGCKHMNIISGKIM